MYSRIAAVCARNLPLRFASSTSLLRGVSRTSAPSVTPRSYLFRSARRISVSSVNRTSAVLAYAPTQADLEATEEFSETGTVPREEASLKITDAAAEQLRNISVRENDEDIALRVLVESGGCHGYQYKMELTSDRQPSDYHFVRPPTTPGRVGIIVDPVSLSLLKGSTIDFATELIGSSFRVSDNPQASGKGCGCGVSWELKE
ncbi:[4Fe-4S] proteins maturation [Ceratobasidium sp. 392]|nr:[4Fe-4S] proteins maturation [Ceratobasidium sp. 392]